jgi:hypothetical protein
MIGLIFWNHLSGQHGLVLGFNQRLEIAIDVAHGLTYLHLYAGTLCVLSSASGNLVFLNPNHVHALVLLQNCSKEVNQYA